MNRYAQVVERMLEAGESKAATRIKAAKAESVNRSARMVYGWLTRTVVDMDGEVIVADGVDMQQYFPTMVKAVYFNHDTDAEPVGTARRCVRKDDGWRLDTQILPTPFGDDLLTMIEHGAVGHYSIAGGVRKYGPPSREELEQWGPCDGVIRAMVCREASLVSMPALPVAALDRYDSSIDPEKMATLDRLLTKSLIGRRSAVRAGLDTTDKVSTFGGIVIEQDFGGLVV